MQDYTNQLAAPFSTIYKGSTLDLTMTAAYNLTRDFMMRTFDLTENQVITAITTIVDFGVTQVRALLQLASRQSMLLHQASFPSGTPAVDSKMCSIPQDMSETTRGAFFSSRQLSGISKSSSDPGTAIGSIADDVATHPICHQQTIDLEHRDERSPGLPSTSSSCPSGVPRSNAGLCS